MYVCVCVCMCDESPMCPVGYRLYRGRVIETPSTFVGVGHMAMMAFNTDIMQEVCPPDVVPESSISHSLLFYISHH